MKTHPKANKKNKCTAKSVAMECQEDRQNEQVFISLGSNCLTYMKL